MSGHRFAFQAVAGSSRGGANLYGGLGAGDAAASTSTAPESVEPAADDSPADKPDDKAKAPSAALHFAPIRKRPPPKAKPTVNALSSAFIVASAAPSLLTDTPVFEDVETDATVLKEPAMKLEPKRAPLGDQRMPGDRPKKRKKRKRQAEPADPSKAFAGEYDPMRPNDYHEYKAFVAYKKQESVREARRAADRIAAGLQSDDDDSYESDPDEERERARGKARFFAPPTFYGDDDAPTVASTSLPLAQTADEAYARRVAMSQQTAPPSPPPDEDALRAAAMASIPPAAPSSQHTAVDSSPAFVRSSAPTPMTVPRFVQSMATPSSSEYDIANTPTTSSAAASMPIPAFRPVAPPQPAFSDPTESLDALVPDDSPPPEAGPSQPSPPVPPPAAINFSDAQARARAIAERLSKVAVMPAPPQPPPGFVMPVPSLGFPGFGPSAPMPPPPQQQQVPTHRPDPNGFAKRLMEKHGWKKGQGVRLDLTSEPHWRTQLGANETGILNPLTVEQARKQAETGGLRGATIKSDTRAVKDAADRALYGVESRYVLLRNVCGPDEVDEDLPTEIGDEARKVGIPERVKVHVAPPYKTDVEPIDRVRIFITFSGLVGAYEAVRLFNGRIFNGRTVRAQFFDEAWAERQLWGMPVDP